MNRITRQECEFPDVIMALPHRKGRQQREQNRETARVLQFILSDDTVHYRMDNMTALKMIEDDGPPIQPNRREIRWPHDGPFYIEFHEPIILDPTGKEKRESPGTTSTDSSSSPTGRPPPSSPSAPPGRDSSSWNTSSTTAQAPSQSRIISPTTWPKRNGRELTGSTTGSPTTWRNEQHSAQSATRKSQTHPPIQQRSIAPCPVV